MNIGVKELFRKYFKGSEVVYKIQIHTLSFGMEENGEIKRLHESIDYSDEEYTTHKDAVKKVKEDLKFDEEVYASYETKIKTKRTIEGKDKIYVFSAYYTEEPSPNNNYKNHNYLKYRKYYNIYMEVRD